MLSGHLHTEGQVMGREISFARKPARIITKCFTQWVYGALDPGSGLGYLARNFYSAAQPQPNESGR